jgi:hypothetical protein
MTWSALSRFQAGLSALSLIGNVKLIPARADFVDDATALDADEFNGVRFIRIHILAVACFGHGL